MNDTEKIQKLEEAYQRMKDEGIFPNTQNLVETLRGMNVPNGSKGVTRSFAKDFFKMKFDKGYIFREFD